MWSSMRAFGLEKIAFGQGEAALVFRAGETAGIVRPGGSDTPDRQVHGLGIVLRIGIERMRAGIHDGQHVHVGAEIDVAAGLRIPGVKRHGSVGGHTYAAKEVDVGDEVARSESPLAEFDEKAVARVFVIVVAAFLVARISITVAIMAR